MGEALPGNKNSISPFPNNFSAPIWSSIVLESTFDETWKEILLGKFDLINPVITSTDGRCVAKTKCIPTALAFWANLVIGSSIAFPEVIIKSANSSIRTTIYGTFSIVSSSFCFEWYSAMFLTLTSEKTWNLLSISDIAESKIATEFSAVVITYSSKFGAVIKW